MLVCHVNHTCAASSSAEQASHDIPMTANTQEREKEFAKMKAGWDEMQRLLQLRNDDLTRMKQDLKVRARLSITQPMPC